MNIVSLLPRVHKLQCSAHVPWQAQSHQMLLLAGIGLATPQSMSVRTLYFSG